MIPSFTSGCPSFAFLLAIRIVQESATSHPPPSANPLIAQIEGLPIVSRRWITPWPNRENSFPLTGVFARIEKSVSQFLDRLPVQRVQHLRPVERDERNAVSLFENQILVSHLGSSNL